MPTGTDPLDIYHNGQWYSRNGSPALIALAAQSAAAASITGTLVETTLASVTIRGGSMGPNGSLRISHLWSYTNSANTKNLRIKFGGTTYFLTQPNVTATATGVTFVRNRTAASQVGMGATIGGSGAGTVAGAAVTSALDTSADQVITFTAELTNTGETITLEGYTVEIIPG